MNWTCQRKSPVAKRAIVSRNAFAGKPVSQSRNAIGGGDGGFRLSFAEFGHRKSRIDHSSVAYYLPRISLFYLVESYCPGTSLTSGV
jgi:hypothetical protein